MEPPKPIFSKRSRSRLGLSGAVVALILVIIGMAITLVVGSIVGGVIGGWAKNEGIMIDRAEANFISPGNVCVMAMVKNTGSTPLAVHWASRAEGPAGSIFPLTMTGTTPIQPGQVVVFTGCGNLGSRGEIVSILIVFRLTDGSFVADRRNIPIT
jgi:ABC-type dipeptide/oligopeptide/nickel transport system permease subunit